MSYSKRRSGGFPFCRSAAAGPPFALALALGAIVTVGGVGGVATYVTREKPKGEGRPYSSSPRANSTDTPPPPPADTRASVRPDPPPSTPSVTPEVVVAQRATGALLAKVALLIQRRFADAPTAAESRSSLAAWGELSRAGQEESSKAEQGGNPRGGSVRDTGIARGAKSR